MPEFLGGLRLSQLFFADVVQPLLTQHYPKLEYAAARIGVGSDVLGYDTEMSTDHGWGLTVNLFVRDTDLPLADDIIEMLRQHMPETYHGYPVGTSGEDWTVVRTMQAGKIEHHRVTVSSVREYAKSYLSLELGEPLSLSDWLVIPSQLFLTTVAGAVHHDGVGELTQLREQLAWYPYDVWLYLLAAGWRRIAQEEHLMPRAGSVGDDLGASIIASRLVRTIMQLCFLMEKRYAPYPKWFGTAFKALPIAERLAPILWRVQSADSWQTRMNNLAKAYEILAQQHNALNLTERIPETRRQFFERPFYVIFGDDAVEIITAQIADKEVKQLIADGKIIGNIDQWNDSTDLHEAFSWRDRVRGLYGF